MQFLAIGQIVTGVVVLLYVGVRQILLVRTIALALRPWENVTRRRAGWHVAWRLVSANVIAGLFVDAVVLATIVVLGLAFDARYWLSQNYS